MTFLALIIALVVLQTYDRANPLHEDQWFRSVQASIRGLGFSPLVSFVAYILLPLLVVYWLLGAASSMIFGLVWMAVAVVVLLYSFGREAYHELSDEYLTFCRSGDFQGAYLFAETRLGLAVAEQTIDSPAQSHQVIQRALLYLGFQRWFAVLFYFVLLGPLGALAYRLFQLSVSEPEGEYAKKVLFYADWVPARLLGMGFALTGDFIASRDPLMRTVSGSLAKSEADEVLMQVGHAASGSGAVADSMDDAGLSRAIAAQASALRDLMSRSAGAWLLGISLIVLFA